MKHKKQHEKKHTFETSIKAKIARTRVPAKIKLMFFQPSQSTARLRVARKLNMPSNEEKYAQRTTMNHEKNINNHTYIKKRENPARLPAKMKWRFFPTSLCGVLVFRLDPAALLRPPPPPRRTHHYSSLTHSSLTHSLTPSLTHSLPPSLTPSTHSPTHSLTEELRSPLEEPLTHSSLAHSLTPSLTHSPHSPHSLTHSLTHSIRQAQYRELAFCVAGALHRASWRSCGARGRRWGRGCLSGRRSTQSLLDELRRAWPLLGPRLPLAWQAQNTEPPGRAAARVAAAGAAAAFGVAGAVHRASWTSCGARGRHWPLGPRLPLAWQAQYTEPPGRAAARVAAAGAAAAFGVAGAIHRASWTSCGALQYTGPPGGAAARVAAAGAAAAFGVAGAVHRASWTSCGARGRRWGRSCLWRGRRSTQRLLDELRRAWPPLGPRLPFAWQAQYTEPPHHL